MSRLPRLRDSLLEAAEREVQRRRDERSTPAAWRLALRRLARRVPLLIAVLVGVPAAALAASQLIEAGAPVKSEHFTARTGVGVAIPRTEGLLGIAASDPAGGPPWTMRVYDTSRGLGCVQVGRLVRGRIGVLGEDGAFGDDGRFHPLPAQVNEASGNCVLLDGHGHAFLAMSAYAIPASGQEASCDSRRCPAADARDLFYGLLGPDARSITYTMNGATHTIPTVGRDGAYLIVERADRASIARARTAQPSIVPHGAAGQPIRSIAYAGGRRCTITRFGNRDEHGRPCRPVGYSEPHTPLPSARQLASRVRVERILSTTSHESASALRVSFTAHVAVRSARSGYAVTIGSPNGGPCRRGKLQETRRINRDVGVGRRLDITFAGEGYPGSLFTGCWGTYHGSVYYTVAPGGPTRVTLAGRAAPPPQLLQELGFRRVLVGRFSYRVTRAQAMSAPIR